MAEAEKRMREDDFISDKMLLMGGDEFGDEADIMGAYPRGGGMPGGRIRGEINCESIIYYSLIIYNNNYYGRLYSTDGPRVEGSMLGGRDDIATDDVRTILTNL